jgi:hypothetical protein
MPIEIDRGRAAAIERTRCVCLHAGAHVRAPREQAAAARTVFQLNRSTAD